MLLNSHISAYATCFARKVCGLVRSTWGTSQGEDKLGARDRILNTKVAPRACAGRAPGKHSPFVATDIAIFCIAVTCTMGIMQMPLILVNGMEGAPCASAVFHHQKPWVPGS